MNIELFEACVNLKECLENSEEVKKLAKIEAEMEANLELQPKFAAFKRVQKELEDYLETHSFSDYGTSKITRELSAIKKDIDMHPLVRNYYKQYRVVNVLYSKIESELFSIINPKVNNENTCNCR